ncbi:GNAT family acetyltraansferase [Palaeococcus pacificus DY20341]|uniref:GNAT family acetyltraansferase n=1 Tax=Palaeococcus pacificus DY20341 TaxID=1343739 RepID=A0A075LSN1_9EURY|nr:GNAT family N-acetyltransferase [Palaeococcus pacificus]AIF69096.1 GNAT family acetyltraansferase [Palaeococcus pacificus DY20341]
MEIVKVERPIELKDELLKFVFRVYQGTKGGYPALEWVKKKPDLNDFEGFKKVYEPFLEFRLSEEFDELYLGYENGKIIGTIALVYNFAGKEMHWVPENLRNEKVGLLEFFMVDPEYKGKGYGSKLLEFAIERLKELKKEAYLITFKHLEAYQYYLRKGFREIQEYKEFVVLKFSKK